MSKDGLCAIVTGSASGLGAATALLDSSVPDAEHLGAIASLSTFYVVPLLVTVAVGLAVGLSRRPQKIPE